MFVHTGILTPQKEKHSFGLLVAIYYNNQQIYKCIINLQTDVNILNFLILKPQWLSIID